MNTSTLRPLVTTVLVHLRAFEQTSDVMFAYTGPLAQDKAGRESQLEVIFRQCNHVDETEWIAGRPYRSLSVGDHVILVLTDGTVERWEVLGMGWRRLENGPRRGNVDYGRTKTAKLDTPDLPEPRG